MKENKGRNIPVLGCFGVLIGVPAFVGCVVAFVNNSSGYKGLGIILSVAVFLIIGESIFRLKRNGKRNNYR